METNTDIAQIKEFLKSKKNGDFVSLKFSSEDKPGENDNILKNFIINDIKTSI